MLIFLKLKKYCCCNKTKNIKRLNFLAPRISKIHVVTQSYKLVFKRDLVVHFKAPVSFTYG